MDAHCIQRELKSTVLQQYLEGRLGGQSGAFALLGTCEHCVHCGNKTSDAIPPTNFLTINFCPLLTIFLNEPLTKV